MSPLLKGVIRYGRVEVDEPIDLPEGTQVVIAPAIFRQDVGPVSPEEITHVLASLSTLLPLKIPDATEAELAAWERKINQHGIEHSETGIEDVFR